MKDKLWPITLTRTISDIHSGGFSIEEEESLGFKVGELFEIPKELHELVVFHKKNLGRNLNLYKEKYLVSNGEYKEVKPNVFIHESAQIDEQVIFNTNDGVIVIEEGAHIMPFSYLVGPLRIDEKSIVHPHSYISNSYIGKVSKIGGEVKNTVFESYSNKGHYGFLGDAYVGSWVNIGGGASASNLKNTYGTIKQNGIDTGEICLGPIIACHVKIAMNASIYTGKVLGVSAHIYGTVTCDVPSFTNYASQNNMTILPLEVATKIAERMQKRRNIEITEEEKAMLSYAYTETNNERSMNGVKEGKLSF